MINNYNVHSVCTVLIVTLFLDGSLKLNMSDSNSDKSKSDVSETEPEFLQQTLQPTDLQYQTVSQL